VIAAALHEGELPFSKARELTRVATPETEQTWIQATTDKNMREVEQLVSGRERGDTPTDPPKVELRPRVLRYEVSADTVALVQQAKQILEKELGERLDDDALIRTFARTVVDGAIGPERTHAPYQIAVTTCPECKRGWQDGGGLTVEMSPPALETAECDAQRLGSIDGDERARATSDIPPALRREVLARDHHRCRVTGCRSSRNIDLHHLTPRAAGGKHTNENLLTICESHHIANHEGALIIAGTASDPTFTRRSHNSFTIAALAVDTARVLKERGFDKEDVKVALEKTRAHVGTTELKLEHWIEIAVGYCPKP